MSVQSNIVFKVIFRVQITLSNNKLMSHNLLNKFPKLIHFETLIKFFILTGKKFIVGFLYFK